MKKLFLVLAVMFLMASMGYCAGSVYSSAISSNSISLASGTTVYTAGAYVQGVYVINTCSTTDLVLTFVDGGASGTRRFQVLCKAGLDRFISFADTVRQINFNTNIYVYADGALANSLSTITLFYDRK